MTPFKGKFSNKKLTVLSKLKVIKIVRRFVANILALSSVRRYSRLTQHHFLAINDQVSSLMR